MCIRTGPSPAQECWCFRLCQEPQNLLPALVLLHVSVQLSREQRWISPLQSTKAPPATWSSNLKRGGFQKAPTQKNEEGKRGEGNVYWDTSTTSWCSASSSYFNMNYAPNQQSLSRTVAWAQLLLLCSPNRKSQQPHLAPAEHWEQLCPPVQLPCAALPLRTNCLDVF